MRNAKTGLLRRAAFPRAATKAPTVKETCAQATRLSGSKVLIVGLLTGWANVLFADEILSLDSVLGKHDQAMARLQVGTGWMDIELYHEDPKARHADFVHVAPGQTRPSDEAVREQFERQGFNPAKGHLRARCQLWFKGQQYRIDQAPIELPEGQLSLGYHIYGRFAYDGAREILATFPSKTTTGQAPWKTARVQLRSRLASEHWADPYPVLFIMPAAVDVRRLMLPSTQDLGGDIMHYVGKLGMEAIVESVGGKIQVSLSNAERHLRYIFDPACDYHVVHAEHTFLGKPSLVFDATYRQVNGAWFLDRLTAKDVEVRPDDGPADSAWTDIKVQFREVQLGNAADVPDQVFTLDGMGVAVGTPIRDMTTGQKPKEYRYKQETQTPE